MRLIPFLTIFAFLGCTTPPPIETQTAPNINWELPHLAPLVGHYIMSKHHSGRVRAMEAQKTKEVYSKTLWVVNGVMKFDGQECKITKINAKVVPAEEYLLTGYKTHPSELGIEADTLLVYQTNCEELQFGEFFSYGKDRILMRVSEGVFFKLFPAW